MKNTENTAPYKKGVFTLKQRFLVLLGVYIICMACILLARIFKFHEISVFFGTSVLLFVASFIVKEDTVIEKVEMKERKKPLFSSLCYSSWVLVAIPLILVGDFLSYKAPIIGYDLSILRQEFSNKAAFIIFAFCGIAYEKFFRRSIFRCVSAIKGKKIAAVASALLFSLYFLDIRLFLSLIPLSLVLTFLSTVSAKYEYIFAAISPYLYMLVLYFLSGEYSGAENVGAKNIVGMMIMFSSIAAACLYCARNMVKIREISYIERMTVIILVFFALLLGSVIVAI